MTTATLNGTAAAHSTGSDKHERPRRSLEELARNLVATLFGTAPDTW